MFHYVITFCHNTNNEIIHDDAVDTIEQLETVTFDIIKI
jgi:hypothetical protein